MSLSTVRRERLIGPLGLVLLAALLLCAFFVFRPASVPGTAGAAHVGSSGVAENPRLSIDELDLAYIRAARASGEISDAEIVHIINDLLDDARSDEVNRMLAQYPDLSVDADSRSIIDLKLAAAESDTALSAALQGVLQHTPQVSMKVLESALVLSKRLRQPTLTYDLYQQLASGADVRKAVLYRQCANHMTLSNQFERAVSCYHAALAETTDAKAVFEIRLALLPLLAKNDAAQQMLVDTLLSDRDLDVPQLEQLAPGLLAAERSDAAYRIYARLALADESNATRWLSEATTWAKAANRPADAAVFLDSLATRVSGAQRSAMLEEVVSLLMAAGRSDEAFERTRKNIALLLSSDASFAGRATLDQALAKGIALARQLGKTEQALAWNTQRLSLDPDNPTLFAVQSELALASADLPLALSVAQQAVSASPKDVVVRERLARVSEWNARLSEAVEQWLWLSDVNNRNDEHGRRQALRELVRVASATRDSARALRALRELSLLEAPDEEDVLELVSLYELEGMPAQAARALNDIMVVHGKSPFLLRSLALHEYKHKSYSDSLLDWQRYTHSYGNSSEAMLYQIELLWRLNRQDDAARLAKGLRGHTLLSRASDYQLRLVAEIAWRYRLQWLDQLVQPRIKTLQESDIRTLYGRRSLDTLTQQGRDKDALEQAMGLWQNTGQNTFALTAMALALKRGEQQTLEKFLPEHHSSASLRQEPDYWASLATVHLRSGETDAARKAYRQALKLEPQHLESIAGIVWMDIAAAQPAHLQSTLHSYDAMAQNQPELWQAMAVGYLQLGAASSSVSWFEKLLKQIDTDYGMLLTYADALEYAGRAADAERVRQYTLFELRPQLVAGSANEQSLVLRQYARLSSRYASANDNDRLVDRLVQELQSGTLNDPQDAVWREDLAISWLMSTQRHEQARVLMSNLHGQRLEAPVWQRLALAIRDKDKQAIEVIVQAKGPMSIGNHILALRQLGYDRQAYAMAQQALSADALGTGVSTAQLQSIAQHYAALRSVLPSYVSASFKTDNMAGLSSTQRGFSVRHSLVRYPLGVGLDISKRSLGAGNYRYDGDEELGDVALSLFFGNRVSGGHVTAGLLSEEDHDQSYAGAQWSTTSTDDKKIYNVELAYRESLSDSAELFLGARQNRASVSVDASLGRLPFMRLQIDVNQIETRVSQERFADGMGGQLELGLRGSTAGNSWSASVQAGQISYQRSDNLPDELSLRDNATAASVLQENAQRLSVGASLSRGVVNASFAQVRTPRYFLNARLGHSWPSQVLGLSVGAGAGIRVLGGDELSFSVQHDTQGVSRSQGDFTSVGVNYRYHF